MLPRQDRAPGCGGTQVSQKQNEGKLGWELCAQLVSPLQRNVASRKNVSCPRPVPAQIRRYKSAARSLRAQLEAALGALLRHQAAAAGTARGGAAAAAAVDAEQQLRTRLAGRKNVVKQECAHMHMHTHHYSTLIPNTHMRTQLRRRTRRSWRPMRGRRSGRRESTATGWQPSRPGRRCCPARPATSSASWRLPSGRPRQQR